MLYLRELNIEDAEKEYEVIRSLPENENGFTNVYHGISREEFMNTVLPRLMGYAEEIGLPEGWMSETTYFLWEDDHIVGVYHLRHRLNEALRTGPGGHISCGILKPYRGRRLGTAGLLMVIEKAKEIIEEEEIYMSCRRDNAASLKMQQNCGAVIDHEDETEYYTRIRF